MARRRRRRRGGWVRARIRKRLLARDQGVCARCRMDTLALQNQQVYDVWGWQRKVRVLGFDPSRSLWEADHIRPLWNGGGNLMGNLQTLCQPCHMGKSKVEDMVRAAHLRRKQQCR